MEFSRVTAGRSKPDEKVKPDERIQVRWESPSRVKYWNYFDTRLCIQVREYERYSEMRAKVTATKVKGVTKTI